MGLSVTHNLLKFMINDSSKTNTDKEGDKTLEYFYLVQHLGMREKRER